MVGEWSNDELKLLKKLFIHRNGQKIADKLGRSVSSIVNKAYKSGFKRPSWSKDELKLLKRLFPYRKTRDVADQLGRSSDKVNYKAYRLGLRKKYFKSHRRK